MRLINSYLFLSGHLLFAVLWLVCLTQRQDCTCLFLSSSLLHTSAKWLGSWVARGAGQTVVARICVLTAVHTIKLKASIWDLLALFWDEKNNYWDHWAGDLVDIFSRHQTMFVADHIIIHSLRNYLINIFTFDTIASVASWTLSTLPGTIRETGALGSSKAGVRQAPIWKQQCWIIIINCKIKCIIQSNRSLIR